MKTIKSINPELTLMAGLLKVEKIVKDKSTDIKKDEQLKELAKRSKACIVIVTKNNIKGYGIIKKGDFNNE